MDTSDTLMQHMKKTKLFIPRPCKTTVTQDRPHTESKANDVAVFDQEDDLENFDDDSEFSSV